MSSRAAPDEVARLQPQAEAEWTRAERLWGRSEAESMSIDIPAGRVLVVDDDPLNRMLLTRSLEQKGHRVGSTASGQEALEILRDKPFDVVLLDIVMPELDGSPCSSD
jgi:PleD family two-component response regulator